MENSLIIGLALVAVLLVLLVMRAKQGKQIPKHKSQNGDNTKEKSSDHDDADWIGQVDRSGFREYAIWLVVE